LGLKKNCFFFSSISFLFYFIVVFGKTRKKVAWKENRIELNQTNISFGLKKKEEGNVAR